MTRETETVTLLWKALVTILLFSEYIFATRPNVDAYCGPWIIGILDGLILALILLVTYLFISDKIARAAQTVQKG